MASKIFHVPAAGPKFTGDFHGFKLEGGIYAKPEAKTAEHGAQLQHAVDNILVRFYGAAEGPWPEAPAGKAKDR